MDAKVDYHAKGNSRVQPSGAPLITKGEKRVCHDQKSLNGRDFTAIERRAKQLLYSFLESPARSPDVRRIAADLESGAEFGGTEVDGIQQDLREVWPIACHVTHECRPVRQKKRVVLSVPMQVEQMLPKVRIYSIEIQLPAGEVDGFHLTYGSIISNASFIVGWPEFPRCLAASATRPASTQALGRRGLRSGRSPSWAVSSNNALVRPWYVEMPFGDDTSREREPDAGVLSGGSECCASARLPDCCGRGLRD